MHTGTGRVVELFLEDGCLYAHISCAKTLIPGSGQFLLASPGSDSLLPVPLFHTDFTPWGFISPVPESWNPGDVLSLRGPVGRGFSLPASARRVGLVAFDSQPSRLRGLVQPALRQESSVVLLCDSGSDHLPDEVEFLPMSALEEILGWADYVALDVARENLTELMDKIKGGNSRPILNGAQVLIRVPMPCGGMAECGVCALTTKSDWKMVCRDGPVFDLREI